MANGEFRLFIYGIVGFIFGLFFFFKGFSWLRFKNLIESTPTSKIRSIAIGLVEVLGYVVPAQGKVLKSPFSNKDCVYYKYSIQEQRSSGRRTYWATIIQGEDSTYFFLKDDTGIVLVDPKGADTDIPLDFEFSSGLGKDPPQDIKMFLRNHNMSFEGFLSINKTMKYIEHFIAPNDKLYVMGTAGDNPFVKEGDATENDADIMIQKGKNDKIYYISENGEKDILKTLNLKIVLGMFSGGLLTIGCLAYMLLFLKLL